VSLSSAWCFQIWTSISESGSLVLQALASSPPSPLIWTNTSFSHVQNKCASSHMSWSRVSKGLQVSQSQNPPQTTIYLSEAFSPMLTYPHQEFLQEFHGLIARTSYPQVSQTHDNPYSGIVVVNLASHCGDWLL